MSFYFISHIDYVLRHNGFFLSILILLWRSIRDERVQAGVEARADYRSNRELEQTNLTSSKFEFEKRFAVKDIENAFLVVQGPLRVWTPRQPAAHKRGFRSSGRPSGSSWEPAASPLLGSDDHWHRCPRRTRT